MKPLSKPITSLLLAAWFVMLAGPAAGPVAEAVSSLFRQASAKACCCGDLCACPSHNESHGACSTDAANAHKSTCAGAASLFSGIGLAAARYSLPADPRVEHRPAACVDMPDEIILNTLERPPRNSFSA